jgi:hypothetical protein
MRCTYRLRQNLLGRVHEDLNRQHPFAAERVGFFVWPGGANWK